MHTLPIEHHTLLAKLYSDISNETGIVTDHLPYTSAFEQLHARFCAASRLSVSMHQIWEQLIMLRKQGKLATQKVKKE